MTEQKPFYSVREFADLIGWPRRTVRFYLKKQLIRGYKPVHDWKIPREGYNSANTSRLSLPETEELLLALPEIKQALSCTNSLSV